MKREDMDWEKILVSCIFDRGFVFRIYKGLSKLSSGKAANLIKKTDKTLEKTSNKIYRWQINT